MNQARDILNKSKRIMFVTGAGISVDSGLPTYRGVSGLYECEKTEDGCSIEDAISGQMFLNRPDITWKYLRQIEENCRGAEPNHAHYSIARLQEHKQITVFTQNIDGFHFRAGSTDVINIHGDLYDIKCTECAVNFRVSSYSELDVLPKCEKCGAVLRPVVTLFGEMLDSEKLDRALNHVHNYDLIVSIGTSAVFQYVQYPFLRARQLGITTIEVNPDYSQISRIVDFHVKVGASEFFL